MHGIAVIQQRPSADGQISAIRSTGNSMPVSLSAHVSVQTTETYLGRKQRFRSAVNDRIGIEPKTTEFD
jgi:hypothetical protein